MSLYIKSFDLSNYLKMWFFFILKFQLFILNYTYNIILYYFKLYENYIFYTEVETVFHTFIGTERNKNVLYFLQILMNDLRKMW